MITVEKAAPALYREYFPDTVNPVMEKRRKTAEDTGTALYARIDGTPAGFMLLNKEQDYYGILYTYTAPEYRNKGVMQALINAAKSDGFTVYGSASDIHEFAPVISHVMEKCGFESRPGRYMYRCFGDDMWDRWDAFLEKAGNRRCETLTRQGYSTVKLSEASEELIAQFRESPHSDYGNELNHQHLLRPDAEITRDISVMCVHDGRLAAYVFAYMPDRITAIYKTLSSSKALHGTGAALLPIVKSLELVRAKGVTRLSFSFDGVGDRANSFRDKVLSPLITQKSRRITYTFDPENKQ